MSLQWGSFVDAGFKELVASADPTLNISEQPVSARYTLCEEIGCGSYGRAVLAQRIEDGLQVVVKQIRLFEMDEKARTDTLTEAKVLAQFNHVNIVHYHECLLEGGVLNIVMEYANGGDLAAAIQRRQQEKKPFTEDEIMFWFVQVVLALYHVHGKNVLHRDLKSQNIFIAQGNLLKLGDFGIARVLNSDTELARTVVGSPYYLSPEICEDLPYNRKSDVWSLGCVLYELSTLRRAFDGQSLPALVVKILRGKYPPVPTRYSTPLRLLIESMLKQNPKDRPTADAILRSDFVRHHVERYASHVMALGLGPGGAAAGQVDMAAAAAALGLAALGAAEAKPRPSPAAHRTPRPMAARPPRGPSVSGAAPATNPSSPSLVASPAAPAAGAAGGGGGGGGGEAERCSSQEVSETDTGSTTPAEGRSPHKAAAVARRGQQRMVETGWLRQQQAALAQLAGALAAQKGPPAGSGAAAAGEGGEVGSPDDAAMDATVLAGHGLGGAGGAAAATAFAAATATKAKLAEIKQQRDAELEAQRRANAAAREQKKLAAARRTHEAAVAVRNRAAERQKEIERGLAEQKAEMEAKAMKAVQLAAAIKSKEDARRREQEEAAQQMSAHREHLRAAKSRVNKDQLSELGAKFKARMATAISGGSGGGSGGGEAAVGGAQVLVVDFAAAQQQQQQQLDRPASSTSSCSTSATKASPSRAGSRVAAAAAADGSAQHRRPSGHSPSPLVRGLRAAGAAAAAAASDSDGGGVGPSGRGKPAAEPPWKLRHKPVKASEFPDVQIFTPFGSEAAASPSPAAAADEDDEGDQQAAAGVLEVLAQIHTVLVESEDDDGEEAAPAAPAGRPPPPAPGGRPRAGRRRSTAMDDDDGAGGAFDAGGGGPQPPTGAAAAAANALKVEQLRIDLERQLGAEAFLAAYRCLRAMEDNDADGDGGSTATQHSLERIMGAKLHLVRQVHKLVTLEDAVFA